MTWCTLLTPVCSEGNKGRRRERENVRRERQRILNVIGDSDIIKIMYVTLIKMRKFTVVTALSLIHI